GDRDPSPLGGAGTVAGPVAGAATGSGAVTGTGSGAATGSSAVTGDGAGPVAEEAALAAVPQSPLPQGHAALEEGVGSDAGPPGEVRAGGGRPLSVAPSDGSSSVDGQVVSRTLSPVDLAGM